MRTGRIFGSESTLFLLSTAVLALIFFYVKVLDYQQLHYRVDLFSMLDAARSWLRGEPLLSEARFGDLGREHNFYLLLGFGPAVEWLGARGLFLFHAVLLWLVGGWAFRVLRQRGRVDEAAWLLLTLYWGPTGFWLWMHPDMGWAIELLFLPLAVGFTLALLCDHRMLTLLLGFALVTCREDGPVLACCLHLLVFGVKRLSTDAAIRVWAWRPAIGIALGWIAVFGAELAWLAWKNQGGVTRSTEALSQLTAANGRDLLTFSLSTLGSGLLVWLLLPVLAALAFGWRWAGLLLLLAVPLFVVTYASGLFYYPVRQHALTWPPRMAILWGYGLSGLLAMMGMPNPFRRSASRTTLVALTLGVLAWQVLALVRTRAFRPDRLVADLLRNARRPDPLADQLRCLARQIPESGRVLTELYWYAPFERHRFVWAETMPDANGYVADVVLLGQPGSPLNVREASVGARVDTARYERQSFGELFVLTRLGYHLNLRPCPR